MKLKIFAVCLLFTILGGRNFCFSQINPNQLSGGWKSIGYGIYLYFEKDTVYGYNESESYCTIEFVLSAEDLISSISKLNNDSLTVINGISTYYFIKDRTENNICKNKILGSHNNPLDNFDSLWETFNENYCSFELRNINWQEQKVKYRNRLNEQSSDKDLFIVLDEMLKDFKDGHVSIDLPDSLENEIKKPDDFRATKAFVAYEVSKKYLQKLNSYNKGVVHYGSITKDISYVQINDCETFANYKINSRSLSREDFMKQYSKKLEESSDPGKDLIKGAKRILNSVMNEIRSSKYCILDLRFNGGGYDEISLEIISHFTKKPFVAFSKKARYLNGFSPEQQFHVIPARKKSYTGKLFILTSHQTASAAEVLVMSAINIDAKRVGSNTEGIFSDMLEKTLPNGWTYSLSNEIYLSTQGKNYEKIGIAPHIEIEYNSNVEIFYKNLLEDLKYGDKAIEATLEEIRNIKKNK